MTILEQNNQKANTPNIQPETILPNPLPKALSPVNGESRSLSIFSRIRAKMAKRNNGTQMRKGLSMRWVSVGQKVEGRGVETRRVKRRDECALINKKNGFQPM